MKHSSGFPLSFQPLARFRVLPMGAFLWALHSLSPKELTIYLEGGGKEGLETWEQASSVKEALHKVFPLGGHLGVLFLNK